MYLQSIKTIFLLLFSLAASQIYTGPEDDRLVTQLSLDIVTNGISTTPDGRLFLVVSHVDGSNGPSIVEYNRTTNTTTAYPNTEWNSYADGKDPATHFVSINSQRIGPDGKLYIVDTGAPTFLGPVLLPYGPKLIQVDITTDAVSRVYFMGNATQSGSFLDDVRFDPARGKAYLTDAGTPSGLIVLDLATGEVQRMLNNHPSTRVYSPVSGEGTILRHNGEPVFIYADQLEVSPDGEYLYYEPASGPLSRITTDALNQAFHNSSMNDNDVLGQYVEPYAHTPSTGGTAIDAAGNVYNSDTDSQRIIRIAPNGTMTTLVQDPRLLWVDAMWIDSQGLLWMPAAQLNRGVPFQNGTSYIRKPMQVFTIDVGVGPSGIDHA
ncbi:hypothetical protein OHC33_004835 [Knufia fluminis]|uniref:Major royal jelly protein n=1 Tax=Knufia fluminis TaxID=191047 RepID=A0AAN8INK2_9EURO|nr:hypothetical protein OHC33_004835 [Knufia fluminis]